MNIHTLHTEGATYYALKTAHEGYVTGACMVPVGLMHSEHKMREIPKHLSQVLGLGTKKHDEESLSNLLESRGILMAFESRDMHLNVSFTCLKKDFDLIVSLIAEQLHQPLFDKKVFENYKIRVESAYSSMKDSTGYLAYQALSEALYPKEHISRADTPEDLLALLKKTSIEDLKAYHASYDPSAHVKWVLVGDIDLDESIATCQKHLKPTTGESKVICRDVLSANARAAFEKRVPVAGKQSVDVSIGQVLDFDYHHPDYVPMLLAVDALGGSFSARLARTVRDEDGLTYSVGSSLSSGFRSLHNGGWGVSASFSPKLLDAGIASIQKQLKIWASKGLAEEELAERKNGLAGKYTVALSSAHQVVSQICMIIEREYDMDSFHTYPERIQAVSLKDVNRVIKSHVDLDTLAYVYAGTFE